MRILIFYLLATFILTTTNCISQESFSTEKLDEQVSLLLKNKKLYKTLLTQDHFGDSAIFVILDNYNRYIRKDPIVKNGLKKYYWATEEVFFNNLSPNTLYIIKFYHNWYDTRYTMLAGSYFIQAQFLNYDNENKIKIPSKIEQLKISKVKLIH